MPVIPSIRSLMLSIIMTFTFCSYGQLQRTGYRELGLSSVQLSLPLPKGELAIFPANWQDEGSVSVLQSLEDGYLLGNNIYRDIEHGQVFNAAGISRLSGIILGVHTDGNTSGKIKVKVRQFDKLPGRILGETIWQIDSLVAGSHGQFITFSNPIWIDGPVVISIDLEGITQGHIGLLSQPSGTDQVWTKTNARSWHMHTKLWKKQAVSAAIWPVIQSRGTFAGGNGTPEDPFQVANAEQLDAMRDYLSAHFIQIADIDLAEHPWNTNEGWIPLGGSIPFTGSYKGGGFTISGLKIDRPLASFQGLFGRVLGAKMLNVVLSQVDVRGQDFSGALAGLVTGGTVQSVQVQGILSGSDYTGGICGALFDSEIKYGNADMSVSGNSYVGGIVGQGNASESFSMGIVVGSDTGICTGGISGEGFVLNARSAATVTGGSEVGGIVGRGEAIGCRASGDVNGKGDNIGGVIGELSLTEARNDGSGYDPGEGFTGDTTFLKDSIHLTGSGNLQIILEDETRFLIPGNGFALFAEAERRPIDILVNEYAPEWAGFNATGSMRTLMVKGSGDPGDIKPIISIPMEEIGTLNPETVVVLRVGDMNVDGDLIQNHGAVLPVITIEDDKLKFVDPMFPTGLVLEENLVEGSGNDVWVGNVKYILLSFDKAFNWSKSPKVERMLPDTSKPDLGNRHWVGRATKEEKEELRKQPICNIVLLVHGHNELEKEGFLPPMIGKPWDIEYKRLVWDLFYDEFVKGGSPDLPLDCTAFYEFIFPTYRPIFSPVLEKSGFRVPTLGEDLGRMVNERLLQDEQISKMLKEGMPFNLYVVTHSQGGLVARSGFRFMDERLQRHLKKVVTWGSPHGGASLYSLLYALSVGHDIVINGVRFPLQNIGQSAGYKKEISNIAIDAPGIRDLRWDVSKKEMLRLGELLKENTATLNEFKDTELPYGRLFFSENLKTFNESEGMWSSGLLKDKYYFYQGITPKLAPLESSSYYLFWELLKFKNEATSIEKGAQLNQLVMNDPYKPNDGAGPVISQGGNFIYPDGGILRRVFQDMDHEEFYGSEAPQRNESTKEKGRNIAVETFKDLGLTSERSFCPSLDLEILDDPDTLILEGNFMYPQYETSNGGNGKPGKVVASVEARINTKDAPAIQNVSFNIEEDGKMRITVLSAEIPADIDSLYITAILKDDSEIYFPIEYAGKALVFNKTMKKWYATITEASDQALEGDTIWVYPGTFKEYPIINRKNIWIKSVAGPESTVIDGSASGTGFRVFNNNSIIEGFTIQNCWTAIMLWETSGSAESIKPIVRDCIIKNNDGTGIRITGSCAPLIERNQIISNRYYGLDIEKLVDSDVDPVVVLNNTIENHNRGIRIRGFHTAWIEKNQFKDGDWGVEILANTGATIVMNSFTGQLSNAVRIYYTTGTQPVNISENTIQNCGIGISADASGIIDIHRNTISNSEAGILLELGNNGSANATIFDNIITGSTIGGGITIKPGTGSTGFQCAISRNTLSGNKNEWANGGGGIHVYTLDKGNVTINDNILSQNQSFVGGGMYISGNVKILKNQFLQNQAGHAGGLYATDDVWVEENIFDGNVAASNGGAMEGRNCTIQKNTFQNNVAGVDGGAIYCNYPSLISGNNFIANSAGNKGGAIFGKATNWNANETVTVQGMPRVVPRHAPCFNETSNTYSSNMHGVTHGEWGPGTDNWCADSGVNVFSN